MHICFTMGCLLPTSVTYICLLKIPKITKLSTRGMPPPSLIYIDEPNLKLLMPHFFWTGGGRWHGPAYAVSEGRGAPIRHSHLTTHKKHLGATHTGQNFLESFLKTELFSPNSILIPRFTYKCFCYHAYR